MEPIHPLEFTEIMSRTLTNESEMGEFQARWGSMLLKMRVMPPATFKLDVYKHLVQRLPGFNPGVTEFYRTARWLQPSEDSAEEAYQYSWDAARRLIARKRTEAMLGVRYTILGPAAARAATPAQPEKDTRVIMGRGGRSKDWFRKEIAILRK